MSNARVCEDVISEMDVGAEGGVGHGARDLRKIKGCDATCSLSCHLSERDIYMEVL
jgi:hypothetical protein